MFRLSDVFLFTSLDKCCGDGRFPSNNGTCIFWGYIGVGTLLVDLFEVIFQSWVLCSVKKNDMKRDK